MINFVCCWVVGWGEKTMLWLQLAGIVAVVAGIVLIIMGLFEDVSYTGDYGIYGGRSDRSIEDYVLGSEMGVEEGEGVRERDRDREILDRRIRREADFGGVVMIGPIPIVFGNNSRVATIAIVLTIVLMLMTFLLFMLPYRMI